MKLIITQYLASLRERDELDAVLPDMLSELGFEVVTRPRRGTRQAGVDVVAVGPDHDADNRRTLFLFVIKAGNLTRRAWNVEQQAVRPSIEEVLDDYIPHRIPEQYAGLPIAICVCMGGEMHEEVRSPWSGFVTQHTSENLVFREWNGERLAQLLLTGILRHEVLDKEHRALFQKAVAMVDQPEVAYRYFHALLEQLLCDADDQTQRVLTRRLRQAYVCLWILFVWARDSDNLEAPYRLSELVLLRSWPHCDWNAISETHVRKERNLILDQVLKLHLTIGHLFLVSKVGPATRLRYSLSLAVRSGASADINLALFETLGRLAMYGIWMHYMMEAATDEESIEIARNAREEALDFAIGAINNNSALLSPLRDDFTIEIALLMVLAQLCDRVDGIATYIGEVAVRLHFTLSLRHEYPTVSNDYRDLISHPASRSDAYFEEHTRASILYPFLMTWLCWTKQDDVRQRLSTTLHARLPHTTHQVWFPSPDTDDAIWSGQRDHGIAVPDIPITSECDDLLAMLTQACEDHDALNGISAVQAGLWPLLLAACRHFRMPIPPQLWQPPTSNSDNREFGDDDRE